MGDPRRREMDLRHGGSWVAIWSCLHQRKTEAQNGLSRYGPNSRLL